MATPQPLQLWNAMQLEKMVDRVDFIKEKTVEHFASLVNALQVELEAKGFNTESLNASNDAIPDNPSNANLEELFEELMLDLRCYVKVMQDKAPGLLL